MSLMPDLRYVRNNATSPTIENKTGAGILKPIVTETILDPLLEKRY